MKETQTKHSNYSEKYKLQSVKKDNNFVHISHKNNSDNNKNDSYNNIKKNNHIDSAVCDVCLDSCGYEFDELIICELCSSSVHQSCYGSDLDVIPKGNWYCQRCSYLKKNTLINPKHVKCTFCPDLTGIMKRIGDNIWAHIVCVNWIPEIYFIDETKNKINYNTINRERFLLKCTFCKIAEGCCIQCDDKSCTVSFHVKCAQKEKLIVHWYRMEKDKSDDFIPVKCVKHKNPYINEKYLFLNKKREKIKVDAIEEKKNINSRADKKKKLFKIEKNVSTSREINGPNMQDFRIMSPFKLFNSHPPPQKSNKKIFKIERKTELLENSINPHEETISLIEINTDNKNKSKEILINSDNYLNEGFTAKIIPTTHINFHNNTFNFSNNFNDQISKINYNKTPNIKLNLNNEILKEKIKFGMILEETNKLSKDILHKHSINKTQVIQNKNIHKNVIIDLIQPNEENKFHYSKSERKLVKDNHIPLVNLIDFETIKEEKTLKSDNTSNKIIGPKNIIINSFSPETRETSVKINNESKLKKCLSVNVERQKEIKNYSDKLICKEKIENLKLKKLSKNKDCSKIGENNNKSSLLSFEKNDLEDIKTSNVSKSIVLNKSINKTDSPLKTNVNELKEENRRKLFKDPDQKFLVKKELACLLKISNPVTIDEIISIFTNYLNENKLLDKKEYILFYKHAKLKELFKTDFLKLSEIKPRILYFLTKNEPSNNIKEVIDNTYINRKKEENIKNQSDNKKDLKNNTENKGLVKIIRSEEKTEKKKENLIEDNMNKNNGWNINTNDKNIDFNYKKIHKLDKIKKRNFFIKDEYIILFKFK